MIVFPLGDGVFNRDLEVLAATVYLFDVAVRHGRLVNSLVPLRQTLFGLSRECAQSQQLPSAGARLRPAA